MTDRDPATEALNTDPLASVSWPVPTTRLTIRRAAFDDEKALWSFRRLDDVSRWVSWHPTDRAEWRAALPSRLATTLVVQLEGQVIGDLMVKVEDAWAQREVEEAARARHAEIGWALDPAFEGRGYATEAVRELLRVCFQELGLRRVTANAFADNEASWRLMERVGMRREAYTVRDSLHRDLGWLDGVGYALLAEEWSVQDLERS